MIAERETWKRMAMDLEARRSPTLRAVLRLIDAERAFQNAKFNRPDGWFHDSLIKLGVLVEEVGEVAKEVLGEAFDPDDEVKARLQQELVEVVSVGVAWLEMLVEVPG